ncbi:hypothetical protein [Luteolibacter sp. LG18]|uniref:hypothetical protein n=1 Tax=Luteolibacter sp. LG18 TaxID=2819286 RepID=UPI002B2AAD9B|nr:hypothetical protein llg_19770 [Luteolibacter sp. LG18]
MPSPAERFLDTAIHPFAGNPEFQIHARRELEDLIDPASASDPEWERAAVRLERQDRQRWNGKLPLLFLVLILTAFFACYYPGLASLLTASKILSRLGPDFIEGVGTPDETRERLSAGLDADQKLILFGSSSENSNKLSGEELWERHPDNPSYFAAYALAYTSKHKKLPPDYFDTANRIDPDNAWFPTFAAVTLGSRSVEALPRTEEEKKERKPKQWKILDPTGLDHAVELLVKASTLPRFESYDGKRFDERISLVPPATDFPSYITRTVMATGISPNSPAMQKLVEVIGAHAQRLTEEGKREELQAFILIWKDLTSRLLMDSKDLVGTLVAHAVTSASVRIFKEATRKLELTKEIGIFDPLSQALEADSQKRKAIDDQPLGDLIEKRGSMLAGIALPMVSRQALAPPPIDEAALKPMRLVDHAWAGRLLSLCAFGFVGIACATAALYRFRHGRLTRLLSSRLSAMMTPADWLWVLVAGGCGPLLVYEAVQYLTPLGIRNWNLVYVLKTKPIHQINAWAALSVIAPIVIARWRIGIRTHALGVYHPRPWLGWIILALCTVLLPLSGLFATLDLGKPWAIAWGVAFSICELWWIVTAIRAIFTRQTNALGRQTTARMVAAAYATAMLALAVTAMVSRAEERYWLGRDTLMQIEPGKPTMGQFEYEVAKVRKAELLEILAPLNEIR